LKDAGIDYVSMDSRHALADYATELSQRRKLEALEVRKFNEELHEIVLCDRSLDSLPMPRAIKCLSAMAEQSGMLELLLKVEDLEAQGHVVPREHDYLLDFPELKRAAQAMLSDRYAKVAVNVIAQQSVPLHAKYDALMVLVHFTTYYRTQIARRRQGMVDPKVFELLAGPFALHAYDSLVVASAASKDFKEEVVMQSYVMKLLTGLMMHGPNARTICADPRILDFVARAVDGGAPDAAIEVDLSGGVERQTTDVMASLGLSFLAIATYSRTQRPARRASRVSSPAARSDP